MDENNREIVEVGVTPRFPGGRVSRRTVVGFLALAGAGVAGGIGRRSAAALQAASPVPGPRPDGTRLWRVLVGGGSDADLVEYNTFFPRELTINAGDAVHFDFKSLHNPHTVTFLGGQEAPPLLVPAPAGTPTAGTPAAETDVPALMFNPAAAFPAGGDAYDGTGTLNSGLNVLMPPDQTFMPTFTQPGTFPFQCLVHPMQMKGTITVQPAGSPVPREQAEVDTAAAEQMAAVLDRGRAVAAAHAAATPATDAGGGRTWEVQAGAEGEEFVLLRYLPDPLTIKPGDTVRWTDTSEMEPHTVTFLGGEEPPDLVVPQPQPGGPPLLLLNPAVVGPVGPTAYDGKGYANSGALGADFAALTGLTTYELTFTAAGEFPYFCVLHGSPETGMRGTVTVAAD